MSRIVSGKIRLDVQPVELPLVVHNAVATVQPAADAKAVRLQTIVDPRVGPVSGDPDRLQQVVWNLLSNAVKFTPKSGRVQVRVERVNSHVEIVVSDTGIGIRRTFCRTCSSGFAKPMPDTTRHGWTRDLDCRSCATSSRCTAARYTRRVTGKDVGRRSASGCH